MTNIVYSFDGQRHELCVKGHANYDAHGHDIVCAGVSAITFTLLGFLMNYEDGMRDIDTHVLSGDVHISCIGTDTIGTAFEMAVIGYQQIAAKYPKHVTVRISATGGDLGEQTSNDLGERP